MTPTIAAPEWYPTVAAAAHQWPGDAAAELAAFLWSRVEPSLRILASVLDEEFGSLRTYSAGAS